MDNAWIETQVAQQLPYLKNRDEVALRQDFETIDLPPDLRASSDKQGAEALSFLDANRKVREVVCNADNKKLITEQITTGNVTTVVAILLPLFGITVGAIPLGIISLAVLILKIGLNQYCT